MVNDVSNQLMIETLVVGELETNCYLVWCQKTYKAFIIDPGDSGTEIVDLVLAKQLKPQAIILTHGHFDHVLGLLEVQLAFEIPSFLHPKDDFLLNKAESSANYWLKHSVDPVPPATNQLSDGQILHLGESAFRVLHTPGHTPGSVCLSSFWPPENFGDIEHNLSAVEPILFCGDTIFKEGIGRTDFKYSNTLQLYKSIKILENTLHKSTRCYSGHGESFYLGERMS